MKLAVSNIAWKREDDDVVAAMLRETGVTGIEVAPTAVWKDPLRATSEALNEYRAWWSEQGLEIVALQALLFGRPELALFGDEASREAMLEHLTGMMDIAAALGAGPMVFGSPKNRTQGLMDVHEARSIAVQFFRNAGMRAADRGVLLCIEPNPPAYDCDFVNTVTEGQSLVREVNSAGFGLHIDAGALALNAESVAPTIDGAIGVTRHFHASEPFLVPLGSGAANHRECAAALRANAYQGWVSMEMRAPTDGLTGLRKALDELRARYGG